MLHVNGKQNEEINNYNELTNYLNNTEFALEKNWFIVILITQLNFISDSEWQWQFGDSVGDGDGDGDGDNDGDSDSDSDNAMIVIVIVIVTVTVIIW